MWRRAGSFYGSSRVYCGSFSGQPYPDHKNSVITSLSSITSSLSSTLPVNTVLMDQRVAVSDAETSKETSKRPSVSSLPRPISGPKAKGYSKYLTRKVSKNHSDIPMILCCLVSGLCDSSSYNAWSCFVSMQTGDFPHILCLHSY